MKDRLLDFLKRIEVQPPTPKLLVELGAKALGEFPENRRFIEEEWNRQAKAYQERFCAGLQKPYV